MFKKLNATEEELAELLEDVQSWMMENDYECGSVGSEIYNQISKILGEEE